MRWNEAYIKPNKELRNIFDIEILENAVFDLVDDSGKIIEQLKTNKNGIAISKPLDIGNYKLIETKSPSGYKISSKPVLFEISGEI